MEAIPTKRCYFEAEKLATEKTKKKNDMDNQIIRGHLLYKMFYIFIN